MFEVDVKNVMEQEEEEQEEEQDQLGFGVSIWTALLPKLCDLRTKQWKKH